MAGTFSLSEPTIDPPSCVTGQLQIAPAPIRLLRLVGLGLLLYLLGSIMVGHRYWMPPPRQFQPMFQVLSTINCYATSSR